MTSRAKAISSKVVKQVSLSLQNLPGKPQEYFSLRETIAQLYVPLNAALTKGYSYKELVEILQQIGISITEASLRAYLAPQKRIRSVKSAARIRKRGQLTTSDETIKVEIPSANGISTYSVRSDFWKAYQASWNEREEVYRRLAES